MLSRYERYRNNFFLFNWQLFLHYLFASVFASMTTFWSLTRWSGQVALFRLNTWVSSTLHCAPDIRPCSHTVQTTSTVHCTKPCHLKLWWQQKSLHSSAMQNTALHCFANGVKVQKCAVWGEHREQSAKCNITKSNTEQNRVTKCESVCWSRHQAQMMIAWVTRSSNANCRQFNGDH